MKDLIFIGGAKGVGKTTLLKAFSRIYSTPIVNTGNIVINARSQGRDPEEEVYKFLAGDYKGIIDTHFVGYYNGGFIRALSKEHLLKLNQRKSIEVVLIDLDLDTLLRRRMEAKNKKRIYTLEHIAKELEESRYFFNAYCNDLNIHGIIIMNNSSNESVKQLANDLAYER